MLVTMWMMQEMTLQVGEWEKVQSGKDIGQWFSNTTWGRITWQSYANVGSCVPSSENLTLLESKAFFFCYRQSMQVDLRLYFEKHF